MWKNNNLYVVCNNWIKCNNQPQARINQTKTVLYWFSFRNRLAFWVAIILLKFIVQTLTSIYSTTNIPRTAYCKKKTIVHTSKRFTLGAYFNCKIPLLHDCKATRFVTFHTVAAVNRVRGSA